MVLTALFKFSVELKLDLNKQKDATFKMDVFKRIRELKRKKEDKVYQNFVRKEFRRAGIPQRTRFHI